MNNDWIPSHPLAKFEPDIRFATSSGATDIAIHEWTREPSAAAYTQGAQAAVVLMNLDDGAGFLQSDRISWRASVSFGGLEVVGYYEEDGFGYVTFGDADSDLAYFHIDYGTTVAAIEHYVTATAVIDLRRDRATWGETVLTVSATMQTILTEFDFFDINGGSEITFDVTMTNAIQPGGSSISQNFKPGGTGSSTFEYPLDAIELSAVTNGSRGTVTRQGDVVVYQSSATGYKDTFTYTITSAFGETSTADVQLVSQTPVTNDAFGVMTEGSALSLVVDADFDGDGAVVTFDFDLNADGTWDLSFPYDRTSKGLLKLDISGSWSNLLPKDHGTYPMPVRTRTTEGSSIFDGRVVVGNIRPQLSLDVAVTNSASREVELTVLGTDPGTDVIVSTVIEWGDGTTSTLPGVARRATHAYPDDGVYQIWVTVTDEDGNFVYATAVEIGPPPQATQDNGPVILQAWFQPIPGVQTVPVTVDTLPGNGGVIVIYKWDLNGDGEYDHETGGPTINAVPDEDGWIFINVAVVDAAGNITEAGFVCAAGFAGAKPPVRGINNYRKLFKDATPAMDDAANAGYKVHHKYQVLRARKPDAPIDPGTIDPSEATEIDGVMAKRFQKELGINVHSKENLAAVTDDVHGKIGSKQKKYWNQKFKESGIDPEDPAQRLSVYKSVPIQDYKTFCDDPDVQYKDYYLPASSSKKDFEKLRQKLNSVQGQQRFQLEELQRQKNLFPNYMLWSPEEKKRLLCPIDSQHDKKWTRTLRECISVRDSRTDAQRAERHPAFALMQVPSMGNDGEKIIPQRLADRMESSGLKGARYKPVKAVSFYEGSGFRANIKSTPTPGYDRDLVSLIFTGSSCLREWEFRGGANACPFCGFKPLVCESCGYIPDDCPQCDEYPFKANAAGIQGIELVTGRMSKPIVEGDRWDGSDLICGRNRARDLVVTRRFVQWLLAIDAAPFVATPLPVCVDRMTADQIRNLAKAQDVHFLLM